MPDPNAKIYPKATQVTLGHVPLEDRLALDLTLLAPSGAELRRAWLTRRMVAAMLVKLSEMIGESHPVAGRTPDPDEVLQMEHLAAVAGTGAMGGRAPSTGTRKSETGARVEPVGYLITEVQFEVQESHVVLGLWGDLVARPGEGEPVAALKLSRHHAHQILNLLQTTSLNAQWGLEHPAQWMQPLKVPVQKN